MLEIVGAITITIINTTRIDLLTWLRSEPQLTLFIYYA